MKKNLKKVLLLVFSFVLALTLSGCFGKKENSPTTASIAGRVIFPEGTASLLLLPLGGMARDVENPGLSIATVYLDGSKYTVTTVDGAFAFHNVPTGTHKLKVSDAYYESQEYTVDVTANGIANINLTANLNAIIINIKRRADGSAQTKMRVALACPQALRVAASSTVRVEYSTGGAYTEITTYPYAEISDLIDISELPLGTDYTFKVSVTDDETGAVKSSFTKKMTLPDFSCISPSTSLTESQPTFSWTPIPGPASYYFNLNGPSGYEFSISGLTKSSYRLPEANEITEFGSGYSWSVEGFGFDPAGHSYITTKASVSDPA